jgi:hypothetical protein
MYVLQFPEEIIFFCPSLPSSFSFKRLANSSGRVSPSSTRPRAQTPVLPEKKVGCPMAIEAVRKPLAMFKGNRSSSSRAVALAKERSSWFERHF